jgi:hydroxymethylglutaryl-CoA synthase
MTAGIISYGTYVPHYRLERAAISEALGTRAGKGSRSVAGFDEDTTSMAVEAARAAINGSRPGSVYLATTAPAYADKTNAAAVHAALRMDQTAFALDLAGSVKGAAGAVRAAASSGGLAVLSDQRNGLPASADEREGGDAAAAFLFGSGDEVIAELTSVATATSEFLDRWRVPGEDASRVWEERFGAQVYSPLIRAAVAEALAAAALESCDHVVVSSPHSKVSAATRRGLPGDHLATELDRDIGYAGTAHVGLGIADVLDRAQPGETILAVLAADGCDAWIFTVTDAIEGHRARTPVRAQVGGRSEVAYNDYLTWRGMLRREPPRRPDPDRPAPPASARTESWKFGFVGSRCLSCGTVHLPPQRVCIGCGAIDTIADEPIADKRGRITTYAIDRLAYSLAPPVVDVVVDFEGGGRFQCEMTDVTPDKLRPGDPVEMTFRRFYTSRGVHNYFWKARPPRGG